MGMRVSVGALRSVRLALQIYTETKRYCKVYNIEVRLNVLI